MMRDGFDFTKLLYPATKENALVITESGHSVEEYVAYINEKQIEQAWIAMPNLDFLRECPSLKHFHIGMPSTTTKNYDFSPLYRHEEVRSLSLNNTVCSLNHFALKETPVTDYSQIKGLQKLAVIANQGSLNYETIDSLKSLWVRGFTNEEKNLQGLYVSKQLDTLTLMECKGVSLDGIEVSDNLQWLEITYNRSLKDISALRRVKNSLKALRIYNCPKIEDFSVLGELENLESLFIEGHNKIPDIQFLRNMKKLTIFLCDPEIEDGDLTPCLGVSRVRFWPHKKHYNVKAMDLPKGPFLKGNEDIEEWRRLE